jgi:hypothetical protein
MTEKMVRLEGAQPRHRHQLIGPADSKQHIGVTIKLRCKTEEGLPTPHEFIAGKRAVGVTRQVLNDRYGASREDADAVQKWAAQQGLSV